MICLSIWSICLSIYVYYCHRCAATVPFKRLPVLCVLCYLLHVCWCQCVRQVRMLRDNSNRALMYHKPEPCKSLHMREIWPLHPLVKSWPWILVLRSAARIRGNLPQTHILLQEIWAYFASALFQKRKKQGYFWTAISGYWQKGKILCRAVIFLLSFSFRVKSRSSWKAKKLTDTQFCETKKKDFPKVKLNSWAMWPPCKLMNVFFFSSFLMLWHCHSCPFMAKRTELWMPFGLNIVNRFY